MKSKLCLILFILFDFFIAKVYAQGDLVVSPNRVVFEGRKQKEQLNLINYGKETTTFSISFVQRRMNEDGSFTIIDTSATDNNFAHPFVRIYPRQVTLAPGEAQVVMLQFRKKSDMKYGEYRSHLYFRSEKDYKPLGSEKKENVNAVSVELIPIFGISIPVIVRTDDSAVITTITDLKLNILENQSYLKMTLNRDGNVSIYGDISVEFTSKQGKTTTVGAVNGVAVYTDITKRVFNLKLDKNFGKEKDNGLLKVYFKERNDNNSKKLYAQGELRL